MHPEDISLKQIKVYTPDSGSPTERSVVAVFDLDDTLTYYDTYLSYLIGFLCTHPRRVWRIWRLPLDVLMFKCRLRDNTWLKSRFLTSILGGLAEVELSPWTRRFADRVIKDGLRPSAVKVLRDHQQRGDRTVLLSASLDIFVKELAARLQFTDCICTVAARDVTGVLSGELEGGNCYGIEKLRRMERLLGAKRVTVTVVSYADHHTDVPLLCWSDRGVLVNPSPRLNRTARSMRLEVVSW